MPFQAIITFAAIPIFALLVYFFRHHRQWLLYYLFGAFGFCILATLILNYFHIDEYIVAIEVFHTNIVANLLGIPSEALYGGRLQLPAENGWSILQIGIECSAVLEISALIGLIGFYPAFSKSQKSIKIFSGVAATYVINIIRMLIIVAITYYFGVKYVFIAHAVIGRLFFFVAVIYLYWYLLTKPTVKSVGNFLNQGLQVKETTNILEPKETSVRSKIMPMLFSFLAISLLTFSFVKRGEWRNVFAKKITPGEQSAIEENEETLSDLGEEKIVSQTPEVLGEKTGGEGLIPALTILSSDNEWICRIKDPGSIEGQKLFYLWLNKKNNHKFISIGPDGEAEKRVRGAENDDWQCFVATSLEKLNKPENYE